MYPLEKNNASPLCIVCMLMPQTITLPTLMLVHICYEESTQGFTLVNTMFVFEFFHIFFGFYFHYEPLMHANCGIHNFIYQVQRHS